MITIILLALFGILGIFLLEGDWKTSLALTFIIGFLQDPIRKLMPDQPSWMVGLVLVGFTLSAFIIYIKNQGNIRFKAMFWTVPQLSEWIPIYFTLIGLQAFNSYVRFDDPVLTVIGIAFYIAPLIGLWVGYQVGCNQSLLERLILVYLVGSIFYAITVFISYRGYEHPLLSEVGEGILITFRYGFQAYGASGLWRTSEIASWHLATASCLALTVAFASRTTDRQIGWLLLATGLAALTITTGRRKSLVLVIVFIALYLLFFSRRSTATTQERIISSILGAIGLSYSLYTTILSNALGENFKEYVDRSISTKDDLFSRFQLQGIGAMLRAIEISGGYGLGVGAGANTGNLSIFSKRSEIQSLGYASEGGGGRLILELGIPGIIVITVVGYLGLLVIMRNYRLLKYLTENDSTRLLGLLVFGLSNIPMFFAAGQLYSDPFVLIIVSICFGSFLAIPTLLKQKLPNMQVHG